MRLAALCLSLPFNPGAPRAGQDAAPQPPAPRQRHAGPDYCWVSKKTLKRKEESCEEGHFSGSFIYFFFLPPRRKLEKQSPQSRIERVTETG